MFATRRIVGAGSICATLVAVALIVAPEASAKPGADVLLSGLSSPKALAIGLDGNPIVGQGTFGPPGPIFSYVLRGPDRGSTVQLLDEASVTDVAEASDGAGWALGGRKLYRQTPDGTVSLVLNIRKYQQSDPDPVDQDGFAEESNPYGLTTIGTDALVTDAANNDLLRVTPEGDTTTVARFDLEEISTDHLPPGGGFPPTLTAEAVPTSVTIGPDGAAYVGELKGFPFRPHSSHVWRVDPNADGAFCSVRTPEPDCTVYASGFTAIHDIAFNLHTGALYVYELAAKGVLAYEKGFETGNFPPAVLIEAKNGRRTRLASGELSQPGGVAVAPDGTVFVTDGMFSDGRLLRIRG